MTDETIFATALKKADPAERAAFLAEACGDDTARRERLEGLLLAHARAANFLERPPGAAHDPDHGATQDLTGTPDPGVAAALTAGGEKGTSDDEALTFLAPPTRPDALGRLGHYEVLQVLGRGGFGIVFRAFDEILQRVVALKVLAPQLAATSPARKRFLREARSSAQVRHENVVQVYEVAEQPLPYLAMEFIPGETLQQKLDRVGPLDVPEVLRIGRQIAEGLAAAHATDLIHRDIKPGNILLEGGSHKAKITDFGLARAADDASISQSGIIAGTPMYMAPEQAQGQTLDQRADLFSLGSVLYQMVAGRPPFRATTAVAVLKRVAEDKPRAIREIIPETPQWLCDIIAKLHAKNPDDRYQSAREVADILADCEAQLKANAKLKDYSRIPRSQPRRSGRKWVVAAAGLLLAVVALAVTELAGVTHLFRGQLAMIDPIKLGPEPTPPRADGWVQLFNGTDLTGWKTHPDQPGDWRVEDGVLVGRGPQNSHLFSDRGDYGDFRLRVEAKLDPGGNSGVCFRSGFELISVGADPKVRAHPGFEADISDAPHQIAKTGTLWRLGHGVGTLALVKEALVPPDTWFQLEIIAVGPRITVKLNGRTTADWWDDRTDHRTGHVALQVNWPITTTIRFRKIEIKELPANTKPDAPPPTITNSLGMEFKLIPAGKFTMGSSKEEIDRCLKQLEGADLWVKKTLATEGPEHLVEITQPFYLGATEVTVGQFRQFVDEQGYQVGDGRWRNPGFDQTDKHPVIFVSWHNAVDFCKWLSKKEGKEYRLPTEAEWEYSCRAGKAGSRYCFGGDAAQLEEYAWYATDSGVGQHPGAGTHPVGKKKPNAWGLYGMHGNAWEWCQDNYDPDYYKNSPVKDPPGPSAGGGRVARGGSWPYGPVYCRSAFRGYITPDSRHGWGGFRVLLVPPPGGVRTESGAKDKPPPPAIAPFTDADVQRIAALPAEQQIEEVRRELKRRNPGFDGRMETKIEGGVVTEFQIVTDKVTDIAPIRVFDALRVLVCSGTLSNAKPNGLLADLTPLEGMNLAGLTGLGLWNTKVSDAGLAYFKDCKGLRHLGLGCTKVSDAGLANFKDCKNLIRFWVHNTQVGDAGLAHFHDCKDLADLNLAGTKVSDVGLAHFKDCKNLKYLWLDRTQVGDAGLAHFKGMLLRALSIDNTAITDLTPLQGMPLEEIRLTPKNITKGLDILRDMKSLKTIGIAWQQSWPAAEFWQRYDKGEFK